MVDEKRQPAQDGLTGSFDQRCLGRGPSTRNGPDPG